MKEEYEQLKLENQLCFPLYACAKEIVRKYKPFLDPLDLTYTQYITMMVLWARKQVTVKQLVECLWLDSGTLTPLLKKLEHKGYIIRRRSDTDERNVVITITEQGEALRAQAADIPARMGQYVKISAEDAMTLHRILYDILRGME